MKLMDISEIKKRFNGGEYSFQMEIPAKVPENHVFDEELSVKKNREMVAEHNHNVEELRKQKTQKQSELSRQLTSDVINYITYAYDITETQARMIEAFVYKEKHASMADYFAYIDELSSVIDEILKVK